MKRPFVATVWQEDDLYVSQCLEVDIASQGATEEEALENLKEALALIGGEVFAAAGVDELEPARGSLSSGNSAIAACRASSAGRRK